MSTLDEDLLNKITYSPECQATFRKYKEGLKKNIMLEFFRMIGGMCFIFFILFITISDEKTKERNFPFYIFIIIMSFILLFFIIKSVRILIGSIKDFKAQQLDIRKDIFVKTLVSPNSEDSHYQGVFEQIGTLHISGTIAAKLLQKSEVYIVFSLHNKVLLDIIPADKIDKPTP